MSILIRPLEDSAIPDIFDLLQNRELYRYLPFPPPKSLEELALRFEVDVRPEGQLFTVHSEVAPEQPIGFCRYRLEAPSKYEIGYTIGRNYWRQGYATCVVGMLLDELSRRFGAVEVIAQANVGNVGSIRALERNGFLYSKLIDSILNREASYELEYSRMLRGASRLWRDQRLIEINTSRLTFDQSYTWQRPTTTK